MMLGEETGRRRNLTPNPFPGEKGNRMAARRKVRAEKMEAYSGTEVVNQVCRQGKLLIIVKL